MKKKWKIPEFYVGCPLSMYLILKVNFGAMNILMLKNVSFLLFERPVQVQFIWYLMCWETLPYICAFTLKVYYKKIAMWLIIV